MLITILLLFGVLLGFNYSQRGTDGRTNFNEEWVKGTQAAAVPCVA
jgi:hypothetical protein